MYKASIRLTCLEAIDLAVFPHDDFAYTEGRNQPNRDTNAPSLPKISLNSSYTRWNVPSFQLLANTLVDVANVVSLVRVLVMVFGAVVCEEVGSCPGGNTVGNVSTGPPPE